MALNIKDETTDHLARELAEATGESITVATRIAISERLARVRYQRREPVHDRIVEIVSRGRARRVRGTRSAEEILGYGPDGLPG